MTNTLALRVENVSKLYRLGEVGTGTLSHDLNRLWARLTGKEDPFSKVGSINDRAAQGTQDYVWALRDINLDVRQGEIVGIIGRNGAGKSTLLKLLSRVTAPTEGSIYINGRIASLLEVGTGFHPELTGRENIFLNGAILGMTKREILARFDEIVEFSGCAKYIETPVKRYSSGMHVRLAFAVAAHLETDILIVDEVLAVGDAEFQRKCLGKMQVLSRSGHRTVLFVSHNMAAVRQLCPQTVLMDRGTVLNRGETNAAIEKYMAMGGAADRVVTWTDDLAPSAQGVILHGIFVRNSNGNTSAPFTSSDDISIDIEYELIEPRGNIRVTASIYNSEGILLFLSSDYKAAGGGATRPAGRYVSKLEIPGNFLLEARYIVEVGISIPQIEDILTGYTCSFEIAEMAHDNWGPKLATRLPGLIHPDFEWQVEAR